MLKMHCNYPTKSNVVKEILLKKKLTKCWMQGNPKLITTSKIESPYCVIFDGRKNT